MGLIKSEEEKELEKLGLPINEQSIRIIEILNGKKTPRNFWKDLINFKIAVKIATADLGYNSSEALAIEKNGKYKCVFNAFQRHRNKKTWFGRKIEWKKALKELGIEYKSKNISWSVKRAIKEIEDKEITSWNELEEKSPRLKEAILRGAIKNSLRELIEMSDLEHKWSKENFVNYLIENEITTYRQLKRHPEAMGVYTKNSKEWGPFKGLINGDETVPQKKTRKKQKRTGKTEENKTEEQIVKKAKEVHGLFCPADGSLLTERKKIKGKIYMQCKKCKNWYKVGKIKTNF